MFRSLPVNVQLVSLLIVAALPVVGALAWQSYQDREVRVAAARQTTLSVAKLVAQAHERFLSDSERSLEELAQTPDVFDPERCADALGRAHDVLPQFLVISRISPDGRVVCASPGMPPDATLADTVWFRAAQGRPGLTASGPFIGPATKKWVVTLSLPVDRRSGGGWVAAAVDLTRFEVASGALSLPDGSVITLLTSDGVLIAREPALPTAIGRHHSDAEVVQRTRGEVEGVAEVTGLDGRRRIYGFTRVGSTSWRVHAGVPSDVVFGPAKNAFLRAMGLVLLALALLGWLSLFVYRSLTRAGRVLQHATRVIESADWSAHVEEQGPKDMRQAIRVLNGILAQRGELEREIQRREAIIEGMFDTAADGIVVFDDERRIALFNRSAERIFGWSADEVVGCDVGMLLAPSHAARLAEIIRAWREGAWQPRRGANREIEGLRKDGSVFPLDVAVGDFRVDRSRLYTAVLRDVTQRHAADRALRDAVARLRQMSRYLVDVQERERRSIAHELHDQIGQSLTAAQMRLRLLLRRKGIDLSDEDARRLSDIIDGTVAEVRSLSRMLRPAQLDHLGLAAALQDLVREMCEPGGIQCDIDAERIGQPPEDIALVLYRIAQEALTNVVRHSKATRVALSAHLDGDTAVLRVIDDGTGFAATPGRRQGIGLEGMQERAAVLGGSVKITTAPGQGTEILVRLPL